MTVADLYCDRADLHKYGYRPGAIANPARTIATIVAATDVLALDDHGLADDDELLFRVEDGGTLPAELVEGTTYYARDTSSGSTFKVSATAGGAAINITTAGADVLMSTSIGPVIDATIEKYSRLFDTYCVGHSVPLTAGSIPAVVRAIVAEASAAAMLEIQGQASEIQTRKLERVEREFARLAKGIVLRDANATASTNLATYWGDDSRGWDRGSSEGVLP